MKNIRYYMDLINERLKNCTDFESTKNALLDRETIRLTFELLKTVNLEKDVSPRELLACYMMIKHPNEIFGPDKVKDNVKIMGVANNVINCTKDKLHEYILEFITLFQEWKQTDYQALLDDIFQRYHQLTVDMMNSPEEMKPQLEDIKKGLLKEAGRVGGPNFVNKILSYSPVVINLEALQTQYDNAFWDKLNEEYENKNYNMIYELLTYLKSVYVKLAASKIEEINDILDVDFIKQRLENNAYTNEELTTLANNILDIVKTLHAPVYDEDLENYRKELNDGNLHFPTILKRIVQLTRNIIQTLEQFKSA
jgi:hypothetical protein